MATPIAFIVPTLRFSESLRRIDLLIGHLPRELFDVHVVATTVPGPQGDQWQANQISVTAFPDFRLRKSSIELQTHLSSLDVDVVHIANDFSIRSMSAVHGCRRRRVIEEWPSLPECSGFRRWLNRSASRNVSRFVTSTSFSKDYFCKLGYAAERIAPIPFGLPQQPNPSVTNNCRSELLATWNLSEDSRLIATAGPLITQRRIKDLIWGIELLKSVQPNIHFLVFGDGPELWRLQRYVHQIELDDHVTFLSEEHDPRTVFPFLDCYWHGGSELTVSPWMLLAMAADVPVVCCDSLVNRQVITDNETGFLVPVGDRAEFARRTNVLLNDSSLARQFGAAGKNRVREQFPLQPMISEFTQLYGARSV